MIRQEWQKLSITCDSEGIAKQREVSLSRNEKVKSVVRNGVKVSYEQLNWVQEDFNHESRDD